jgi:hypothetical protein
MAKNKETTIGPINSYEVLCNMVIASNFFKDTTIYNFLDESTIVATGFAASIYALAIVTTTNSSLKKIKESVLLKALDL